MKKSYSFLLLFILAIATHINAQHTVIRGNGGLDTVSAPYCKPTFSIGNSNGDYIETFQLSPFPEIAKNQNNYPYVNSMDNPLASLYRGEAYTLTLKVGEAGNQTVAAWIDFDHNDTFDSNEKLGESTGIATLSTTTFSYTIPANAPTGVSRVRILTVQNGLALTPCGNYQYGEASDFLIYVNDNPAPYCGPISMYGSSAGDYLTEISFGTLNYTGEDSLGSAYIDLTNTPVAIYEGNPMQLKIRNNYNYPEDIGFWIDWNNDQNINANELIGTLSLNVGQKDSITITVPSNQPWGQYRLRVRLVFDEDLTPCASGDYSIAYDITVAVGEVSVNENFASNFSLYPNPVSNTLFLTTKNGLSNNSVVTIYDGTGRMVSSQKVNASAGSRIEIRVSGLTNGIYIIQVIANGKTSAQRFVVE